MKCGYFFPTNVRYPNPISVLPSYVKKNRGGIVLLKSEEVEEVSQTLQSHPVMRIAAAVNDEEEDIDSSLKTGERIVTMPPLRDLFKVILPMLKGKCVLPNPAGMVQVDNRHCIDWP